MKYLIKSLLLLGMLSLFSITAKAEDLSVSVAADVGAAMKEIHYQEALLQAKAEKSKSKSKDYYAISASDIENRGAIGRLVIPGKVDVAIFNCSVYDLDYSQAVIDNKDSAAWLTGGEINIIADHNNQGFEGIKKAVENETKAYIYKGNYAEEYLCISKSVGQNTTYLTTDGDGDVIYTKHDKYGDLPYIVMYTCNEEKPYITVTVWQKCN